MHLCGGAGAAAAALGLEASSSIPPITMVFCMVDGAKDWRPLSDKGRRGRVQRVIKDALVNTLMAVKGSYMCRCQEDEFKYMVAFPRAEVGPSGHACRRRCCIGAHAVSPRRRSPRARHRQAAVLCDASLEGAPCVASLEGATHVCSA